jgi:RHS repeat-associated protein
VQRIARALGQLWAIVCVLLGAQMASAALTAPSPTGGTFTVSYDAPPSATPFRVFESVNGIESSVPVYTTTTPGAGSFLISGRSSGTYTYRAEWCLNIPPPYGPGEVCGAHGTATVVVDALLGVAGPITSNPATATVERATPYTLSWSVTGTNTSYRLEERVGASGAWQLLQSTLATSRAFTGKPVGTYTYRVRACRAALCSAPSAEKSVQVIETIPSRSPGFISGPDTTSTASGTPGFSITLMWNTVTGPVSTYRLKQTTPSGAESFVQNTSSNVFAFATTVAGVYRFIVQACNAAGACGPSSPEKTVTANGGGAGPRPAPAPAPLSPVPDADLASEQVGATSGSFRVTEGGAASYSIPLLVPQGTAGVQPELSLAYSSQSGNGPLGVGWSLTGLSAVTRCRQTPEQDAGVTRGVTLTANDRFCLDGQRLVLAPGASGSYGSVGQVYRTEIESFTKVQSFGGSAGNPGHFKVWRKDGSVTEYGNTASSAVQVIGNVNAAIAFWAINRSQDSIGNAIDYAYSENPTTGEHLLTGISYAGGIATVTVNWQGRPDTSAGYAYGGPVAMSQRISSIVSADSGNELRTYTPTYEQGPNGQSRITAIQECNNTHLIGPACLPATRFVWTDASSAYTTSPTLVYSHNSNVPSYWWNGGKPADVDGDGDADLVFAMLRYNNNGGSDDRFVYVMNNVNGVLQSNSWQLSVDKASLRSWNVMDYNNDGRQDLVYAANGFWRVRLGETTGVFEATEYTTSISTASTNYEKAFFADINSDGLTDLVYSGGDCAVNNLCARLMQRTVASGVVTAYGLSTTPLVFTGLVGVANANVKPFITDTNGDGAADLIVNATPTGGVSTWYIYELPLAGGGLTVRAEFSMNGLVPASDQNTFTMGDINGDGLADAVYRCNSTQWCYAINTGLKPLPGSPFLGAQTLEDANGIDNYQVFDVDGDGDGDVVRANASTRMWEVRKWTGAGFSPTAVSMGIEAFTAGQVDKHFTTMFFDINNDGKPDALRAFNSNNTAFRHVYQWNHLDNFRPDNVITAVVNGLGAETRISYAAMTDPTYASLYTRGTGAGAYYQGWGAGSPVFDVESPGYVVRRVQSSSPSATGTPGVIDMDAMAAVSYEYAHARAQAGGRGFLGFAKVSTIDEQTGVRTNTTYAQNFPYTGMPLETEVLTPDGRWLKRAINSLCIKNRGSSTVCPAYVAGQAPVLPYIRQTQEWTFDLADMTANATRGALSVTTTTTTLHTASAGEDNGAPAQIVVATTGHDAALGASTTWTKTTTNTYGADDAAKWWLGRLTQTTVLHQRTGAPDITRTSVFSYNTTNGQLNSEVVQPSSGNPFRLETNYTFTSHGNRAFVQRAAHNGTVLEWRTEQTLYDSAGRFANETRNALAQVTQKVLARDRYGNATQVQDINGIVSTAAYGHLGRPFFSQSPTGAWKHTINALCSAIGDCPQNAVYRTETRTAGAPTTYAWFDVLGREVRTGVTSFDGRLSLVDVEYDLLGRVKRKSEPYFDGGLPTHWTQNSFDILGRPTETTLPDNSQNALVYSGFATTVTNALGQQKTEVKNPMGLLVKVQDAVAYVNYGYDATGNLTSTVQTGLAGGSSTITMQYDLLGRKIQMSDPDMGIWTYVYDGYGQLTRQTNAAGHYQQMTYDLLGRMKQRVDFRSGGVLESTAKWHYDTTAQDAECPTGYGKLGQLCWQRTLNASGTPLHSIVYAYDGFARPTQAVTVIGSATYTNTTTYDEVGRVFQQFDASGGNRGTEYRYTPWGHVEKVVETQDSLHFEKIYRQILSVDARGNVLEARTGPHKDVRTYDPATGRLLTTKVTLANFILMQDLSYTWDVVGNLTQRRDRSRKPDTTLRDLTENFTYDNVNRLATSTGVVGRPNLTLTYDGLGNITTKSDVGTYTYGTRPHAVTAAGGTTYTYDANGSVVSDSSGRTMAYTAANQMASAGKGSETVSFDYDASRSRYKRQDMSGSSVSTTHYVGGVEVITPASGPVEMKRYVGDVVLTTNPISGATSEAYIMRDHLGSPNLIVDHASTVLQNQSFDAFGQRRDNITWQPLSATALATFSTSITRRGYTGHEGIDAIGLIHMNGRVYDPKLGRFIQSDPFIDGVDSTQGFNRYSYGQNNGLNGTDPSGFAFGLDDFIISVVIASVIATIRDYVYGAVRSSGSSPPWLPTPSGSPGSIYSGSGTSTGPNTVVCDGTNCVYANDGNEAEQTARGSRSSRTGDRYENGAASEAFGTAVDVTLLFLPGGDLFRCAFNGCTRAEIVLAVAAILPVGKAAVLVYKGVRIAIRARRVQSAQRQRERVEESLRVDRTILAQRPPPQRRLPPERTQRRAETTCCFVAGTLVATKDGLKPIESIVVGDSVLSRDVLTGETDYKPVENLVRRHERQIWVVEFMGTDGRASFETTDDHPWRSSDGRWLKTLELSPGVLVERRDGEPALVVKVEVTARSEPTYNLDVADFHTYFVGESMLLVHNCDLDIDDLSRAAGALDESGVSAATKALQSHTQRRGGSAFPPVTGNKASRLAAGQAVIDDILTNPGSTFTRRTTGRFGEVLEVRAPDGRGVRFGSDGSFIGLLEP